MQTALSGERLKDSLYRRCWCMFGGWCGVAVCSPQTVVSSVGEARVSLQEGSAMCYSMQTKLA
jgi:hypothetical protein